MFFGADFQNSRTRVVVVSYIHMYVYADIWTLLLCLCFVRTGSWELGFRNMAITSSVFLDQGRFRERFRIEPYNLNPNPKPYSLHSKP